MCGFTGSATRLSAGTGSGAGWAMGDRKTSLGPGVIAGVVAGTEAEGRVLVGSGGGYLHAFYHEQLEIYRQPVERLELTGAWSGQLRLYHCVPLLNLPLRLSNQLLSIALLNNWQLQAPRSPAN